ncbi:hypothetical protein CJU90_1475 [Yarrowia sp. C11]|nr:hypothetical protein CKK34_0199 [Yarrowia sp. E02]KAG5371445.1 hypothetical protein CJU90_1475 [Yarrowia sp. C11]
MTNLELSQQSPTAIAIPASPVEEPPKKKNKRGRPRLQTSSAAQAERRRAQVRDAQRQYRQRRDNIVHELTARVEALEKVISCVESSFFEFYQRGVQVAVRESNDELMQLFAFAGIRIGGFLRMSNNTDPNQKLTADMVLKYNDYVSNPVNTFQNHTMGSSPVSSRTDDESMMPYTQNIIKDLPNEIVEWIKRNEAEQLLEMQHQNHSPNSDLDMSTHLSLTPDSSSHDIPKPTTDILAPFSLTPDEVVKNTFPKSDTPGYPHDSKAYASLDSAATPAKVGEVILTQRKHLMDSGQDVLDNIHTLQFPVILDRLCERIFRRALFEVLTAYIQGNKEKLHRFYAHGFHEDFSIPRVITCLKLPISVSGSYWSGKVDEDSNFPGYMGPVAVENEYLKAKAHGAKIDESILMEQLTLHGVNLGELPRFRIEHVEMALKVATVN